MICVVGVGDRRCAGGAEPASVLATEKMKRSCIARGHETVRVMIDGRWYWKCLHCPHRVIAAPPRAI